MPLSQRSIMPRDALVEYEEDGMPVGNMVITDREKLLKLLTIAKAANNYRYIFMDVNFEEGINSPSDSALFQTIKSMDRIVIPVSNMNREKPAVWIVE